MILFDHLSLLSLCFPFSFWLSLCALSAPHAPPLLCCCPVSGEDLERNDGSSSRPYYMSPGLHKILRKVEEDAKLGTTSWAMCGRFTELVTLSLTSPYLLYVCGGSGHLRASTVGLNIKTGCIPAWSGTTWKWKDMLSFQFLTEKAWGGLEKDLCLLPLLSQLRYLPFFLPCLCSIFFFFSVFSADLCLTKRVRVNSPDGHTGWDEYEHFHPNKHEDLKMYRCHWWTMA